MLAFIAFFIFLIPLIIIHELGHFFAGKSVGITILEFGIGFPPRAATLFTKGDTVYTLNWLPLGGFVRPFGEGYVTPKSREEMQVDLEEIEGRQIKNPKSLFDAGPWERIWFMFAGPLANFVTAFVLFVIIAMIGFPDEENRIPIGVVVDRIEEGSVAESAGLEVNDYITNVNGVPTKTESEFNAAMSGQEDIVFTIDRDGDVLELELARDFTTGETGVTRPVVLEILDGSPAEEAGLELNDMFIAVDGEAVHTVDDIINRTKDREGEAIVYTIQRGEELMDITIRPRHLDDTGRAKLGVGISAINPSFGFYSQQAYDIPLRKADNIGDAIDRGGDNFLEAMELTVTFPIKLIRGEYTLEQARPASFVTISRIGGEVIRQSQERGVWYPILGFSAILSIAVAVTNLLPIPALDGGRILFVIIELIRGKPMEPEREGFVHLVGFLFLLSLMAVILIFEVIDPFDLSSF